MNKKFYITTAIPYVNANPHIGFSLELLQADVVARYNRLIGSDTFFLTGTDDNALKNVQAAERAGKETKEFVNENQARFILLSKQLGISYDDFIKTADKFHHTGAQKFWSSCKPDDLYKKKYSGFYCVGCEAFYTEKDLVDGKCPEHDTALELVEEENYFFKLSNYQKKLEELVESDKFRVVPESRKNEVLSFIKSGLEDFSISRSVKRAKNWGVRVPGDDSQIMYVWFDALSNYITALDYEHNSEKFQKYWPADVQVIGKGIIRFHAVYWPAMLLSAGLQPPKVLFVHGYINIDGGKMSKSLGNVIDPFEILEKYGVDTTRYYLLRYIHPVQDSDFSYEKLEEGYRADLANGIGNLASRVSGLIEKNGIEVKIQKTDIAADKTIKKHIENFQFDQGLKYIWEKIRMLDVFVSEKEPWTLAKTKKLDELKEVLQKASQGIYEVAVLLQPFLPQTSERIIKQFTSEKITKGEALFPRFEIHKK